MKTMKPALLALLLLAGCSSTRAFLYHPSHSRLNTPPGIEDVTFWSADGTRLHGWLRRTEGATRAVLACHGNAGDVTGHRYEIDALARATKAHVLEFDYRGYGLSEGEPEEKGVCEDAQAALLAVEQATGVPAGRIVVLGHSLGGAVAVDLAWRKPAIGGVVVMASFTTLDDLIAHLTIPGLSIFMPDSFDSMAKVPFIAKPKLFIHGTADPLIPLEHARALHARAAEPKELLVVDGAEHGGILGAPHVLDAVAAFVEQVAPIASAN